MVPSLEKSARSQSVPLFYLGFLNVLWLLFAFGLYAWSFKPLFRSLMLARETAHDCVAWSCCGSVRCRPTTCVRVHVRERVCECMFVCVRLGVVGGGGGEGGEGDRAGSVRGRSILTFVVVVAVINIIAFVVSVCVLTLQLKS